MNRTHIGLALTIITSVACTPSPASKPLPTATVATSTSAPAAGPESNERTAKASNSHLWTVLPYRVTDGMEYGPSHVVLDERAKLRFTKLAHLPNKAGHSLLVRVQKNDPMPDKYGDLADFVWPAWKVVDVVAERREDTAIDWNAPVVSASVKASPKCTQITVQVFESYTFCSTVPLPAGKDGAFLFLEKDFYPFPTAGAPMTITVVPELDPIPAP